MISALLLAVAASDIRVSLSADVLAVRLSGVVRLVLVVEGSPPLRVELPPELLDSESAANWKLTAVGPPTINTGRWEQQFVADPFIPGEGVRLGFAPVAVWAGGTAEPRRMSPQPQLIRVTTGVTDLSAAAVRPTTGVENLPALPSDQTRLNSEITAGVIVGVVLLLILSVRVIGRWSRHRPVPTVDPFVGLSDLADATFAHRLSDAVRDRVHSDAIPARRLTTPDLPPGPIRDLLERLDAVRFGSRPLTLAERAAMLDTAYTLIGANR